MQFRDETPRIGAADSESFSGSIVIFLILSSTCFAVNSPKSLKLDGLKNRIDVDLLDLRSVTTAPHLSNTAFSLLKSRSRSVVPDTVPVGIIPSLTESYMTRDYSSVRR
jgi:hypothetical protein